MNEEIPQQNTVEAPTQQPQTNITPDQAPEKKSKKKLIIGIAITLLLIGGVAAWALNRKQPEKSEVAAEQKVAEEAPVKKTPESVLYFARANENAPYAVYSRPANGGEKQTIMTLNKKPNGSYYSIAHSDVYGQNVVFDTNDGIYLSKDGGKTFTNIYKLDPAQEANNQAITSLIFSSDGKKIVFALLPAFKNGNVTNTAKTMDLDGGNLTDLHTVKEAGLFVYNYNPKNQQLIYATGCYNCDGKPSAPHVLNTKSGNDKVLITINNNQSLNGVETNKDGTKILYTIGVLGKNSDQLNEIYSPWGGTPPYKVIEVDVATGKSVQEVTLGKLYEKKADGSYKTFNIQLGYTADTDKPYYTSDNAIYKLEKSTSTLLFEGARNIRDLPYVSADDLFVGIYAADATAGNYDFNRYVTSSKQSTSILKGDSNVTIIGVTTK